jgi:hypothetical protein
MQRSRDTKTPKEGHRNKTHGTHTHTHTTCRATKTKNNRTLLGRSRPGSWDVRPLSSIGDRSLKPPSVWLGHGGWSSPGIGRESAGNRGECARMNQDRQESARIVQKQIESFSRAFSPQSPFRSSVRTFSRTFNHAGMLCQHPASPCGRGSTEGPQDDKTLILLYICWF